MTTAAEEPTPDPAGAGETAGPSPQRLRLYTYLTARERQTYLVIIRLFTRTLLADLGADDVAAELAQAERSGQIDPGESDIDTVLERLRQLETWGNLLPGRREPAATIADFTRSRVRYQIDKLALRVQRHVDELLAASAGAREVSRELLPAIDRGLREIVQEVGDAVAAEEARGSDSPTARRARETLGEHVTTLFLQHAEFTGTVRDFYAYLSTVIARYDLEPAELAGFKNMLLEYVDLVVDDVLRYAAPIADSLARVDGMRGELLRLLGSAELPAESVERPPGRSEADWAELADWFISGPGRPSQIAGLRDATSRAITSLLANVKRVTSAGSVDPGHRHDLIRLASWFAESGPETAHALYASAFGLFSTRHLGNSATEDRPPPPDTPWRDGPQAHVEVNVRSRQPPSARGRTSRIPDDPLGERALLDAATEESRELAGTVAELVAAAPGLDEARLSGPALELLCELLTQASDSREHPQESAEATDPVHGLRVTLYPVDPARQQHAKVSSVLGTLTIANTVLEVTSTRAPAATRHGTGTGTDAAGGER